jgi:hypothetical protein
MEASSEKVLDWLSSAAQEFDKTWLRTVRELVAARLADRSEEERTSTRA